MCPGRNDMQNLKQYFSDTLHEPHPCLIHVHFWPLYFKNAEQWKRLGRTPRREINTVPGWWWEVDLPRPLKQRWFFCLRYVTRCWSDCILCDTPEMVLFTEKSGWPLLHAQRETNKRDCYLNHSGKTLRWETGDGFRGLHTAHLTEAMADHPRPSSEGQGGAPSTVIRQESQGISQCYFFMIL